MVNSVQSTLGISDQVSQVQRVSSSEESTESTSQQQQESSRTGYSTVNDDQNSTVQFYA